MLESKRALVTVVAALLLLLVSLTACDMTGLPATPTPRITPTSQALQPTVTSTATGTVAIALQDTQEPTPIPATETQEPALTPAKTTTPPTTGSGNAQIDRLLEQIKTDTAKLRGLEPKKKVPEQFITQQQLNENLKRDMAEDYTPEEARRDAVALWLLRLVNDPSIDLYQLYLDLLTEQVAGYYDPEKDELFVLGNQQRLSPLARQTLAHEFVHALQDQHYDLEKLLPEETEDDDRSLAVRALVEGDATMAGLMYAYRYLSKEDFADMLEESQSASTEVLDRSPRYIRESLLFPYDAGSEFVSRLIEQGGFERVNQALADPPASTEQVMHPDKYLNSPRDNPLPVPMPPLTDTLGTGWKQTDQGTLGEFDLKVMLEDNGVTPADEAAAGWGGGRYALYQRGEAALMIVDTRWDTPADAREFENALRQSFAEAQQSNGLWVLGGRFFGMKSAGDRITFISSTDRSALENALAVVR
jgi:hypothetical protein